MNLYKECTDINDTNLASNNPLSFRSNLFRKNKKGNCDN